jgi:hypothetical protein
LAVRPTEIEIPKLSSSVLRAMAEPKFLVDDEAVVNASSVTGICALTSRAVVIASSKRQSVSNFVVSM